MIDEPTSPPELAKRLGVKADTVRGWIESGALEAVNVATAGANRPRWKVMPEHWEAFELSRSSRNTAEKRATRRRQRSRKPPKLKYCEL